jgi:16S rRNA (uracil1498-N3)-methyltransferase
MRNALVSRCYAEPARWGAEGRVELDPEESLHLSRVLHARQDDPVEVFDGCGRSARAILESEGRGIRLRLEDVRFDPEPSGRIRILLGMPREASLDWILQKGTELGVSEMTLFHADRSVVRVAREESERKLARWRKIVRDAAKQCGENRLPGISWFPGLSTALPPPGGPEEWLVLLSLAPEAVPFRSALEAGRKVGARRWTLAIGPEGDFSPCELEILRGACRHEVSLGERVLRVETAALYAISVLRHDLDSPAIGRFDLSDAAG